MEEAVIDCKYFEAKDFINLDSPSLSCVHCNIRSLKKFFENLDLCIKSSKIKFSVTGVTETWLTENELPLPLNCLPVHNFLGKGRTSRPGGGIGILIVI